MKIKQKKSLGQNFLRDPKILKKIVGFACLEKTDTVVEIGPGEGTLTRILLEKAKKVIAIEKDEQLAEKLKQNFNQEILDDRLEIVAEDILKYEVSIMNYANDYKLIGNIPYYITGAIFEKFLYKDKQPKSITLVVQREVAERIVARDGKGSILSISVKVYGEPKFGGVIKAGSFFPKPKVDSAIISIRNINKEKFNDGKITERQFFTVLKKGFAHKRKLLQNNLGVSKGTFDSLGIREKVRAEDLSVDDWIRITKAIWF